MNSSARLLIVLLSLTTLGCALFAYREHSRQAASAQTIAALEKERETLRQRIQSMEKTIHPQLSQLPSGPIPDFMSKGPHPLPQPGNLSNRQMADLRSEAGLGADRTTSVLENPEVKKLVAIQQRAALDARFAALFRELKLSAANLEKFKQLLVDKQTAILDVRTAAQTQGLAGKDAGEMIREMLTKAQTDADNAIRSALGDTGFRKYQTYEETLPERTTVNQLEQRLSYSSSPLTSEQIDKLVMILAESSPSRNVPAAAAASFAALRAISNPSAFAAPIATAALARSESVLNGEQLAALRQLQQEQEAKAQLSQQFRSGPGLNRPPAGVPLSGGTPPTRP